MKKTLVSISCITYNHANYIRDAIEGFLMQKTNFNFEVLIHDDASTDGTAEIIKEYELKYPDIIKPLYEEENQWQKGRRGSAVFNFPRAKGKYIALCEGDDYWTDPYKLQKQVDTLEQNPNASIVFHPCYKEVNGVLDKKLFFEKNKINVTSYDVIVHYGQFAPTSSYFFKKNILKNIPKWFNTAPVGDFFIEMYSMKNSHGIYLKDGMSVYRINTENSWSVNILGNEEKRISFNLQMIKFTKLLQNDFPNISEKTFNHVISLKYLNLCMLYFNKADFRNFKFYSKKYFKHSKNKKLKLLSNKLLFHVSWKIKQQYNSFKKNIKLLLKQLE